MVKVSEQMERLVQLIKGAEGPDTARDPTPLIKEHEHSDDEDNKIEEV